MEKVKTLRVLELNEVATVARGLALLRDTEGELKVMREAAKAMLEQHMPERFFWAPTENAVEEKRELEVWRSDDRMRRTVIRGPAARKYEGVYVEQKLNSRGEWEDAA